MTLINKDFSNKKKALMGLKKARRQFTAASVRLGHPSTQVDDRLGDRAFGFDGLGVRLIVTLSHNQIDQLVR